MPPRRNRPLTDAYEQEFEQRVMARMDERLDQFVDQLADRMNDMMNPRRRKDRNGRGSKGGESENPFFGGGGSSSDEEPDRPRRDQKEDNRRWESGMRVNIPEFDGNTLNPEGFIDWLVAVEEVFEFKEVPENKRVSLIATKLRGRAFAWWQQLKLTRERVGKPKSRSWIPVTLSDANQRALAFKKQNRRVGSSSSPAITGGSSGSGNVTSRFVPNQTKQFQVNTKFLNSLPPEWSKFVTDVKASEFSPSQFGSIHTNQHYSSTYPSQPQFNHSSIPSSYPYQSQINHQTLSVPQIAYPSPQVTTQPITESTLMDSSFVVPVFSPGDDPIACLNKAMAFLTAVASSRFPSTNNQLITSSNLRNQATIQDGRVTVQQIQGRQGQSYSGIGYKSNATSSGGNNASGQARVVKCYNYQGEGHMARHCTQPKRPRNATWYKEKEMLAEAPEAGQILDEEQLVFLADLGVPDSQAVQTIIPNTAAFQTEDLDTYDFDCDDLLNAQAVLLANISNYGSDIIS
ncbi:integrase, catalytic region, zinc finger, CCHC-type containing protein [Tanacetum coccineum]